ncbi:hypothetical protein ANRL3_01209 [Anaerolineae bacterium]|nr:hypothetical protein ANRL3_01209 [Anaerolineae bacterium]
MVSIFLATYQAGGILALCFQSINRPTQCGYGMKHGLTPKIPFNPLLFVVDTRQSASFFQMRK